MKLKNTILKLLFVYPFLIIGSCFFKVGEFIAGEKYCYRKRDVLDKFNL